MSRGFGVAAALAMAVAIGGCGGKGAAGSGDAAATAPAVARPALVSAYDGLRARLADDDLAGAKGALAAVEKAAAGEGDEGAAMTKAAQALAGAADLDAARLAFGDLSQAYLTLLARRADLSAGLFVFRCPMAKGYKKWVQVDEAMMNPYMGKAMLECGSKVALAP